MRLRIGRLRGSSPSERAYGMGVTSPRPTGLPIQRVSASPLRREALISANGFLPTATDAIEAPNTHGSTAASASTVNDHHAAVTR